jgi:hypothetical protein
LERINALRARPVSTHQFFNDIPITKEELARAPHLGYLLGSEHPLVAHKQTANQVLSSPDFETNLARVRELQEYYWGLTAAGRQVRRQVHTESRRLRGLQDVLDSLRGTGKPKQAVGGTRKRKMEDRETEQPAAATAAPAGAPDHVAIDIAVPPPAAAAALPPAAADGAVPVPPVPPRKPLEEEEADHFAALERMREYLYKKNRREADIAPSAAPLVKAEVWGKPLLAKKLAKDPSFAQTAYPRLKAQLDAPIGPLGEAIKAMDAEHAKFEKYVEEKGRATAELAAMRAQVPVLRARINDYYLDHPTGPGVPWSTKDEAALAATEAKIASLEAKLAELNRGRGKGRGRPRKARA